MRLRFVRAVRRSYCGLRLQYCCEGSNAGAVEKINMVKLQVMVRLSKNGALVGGGAVSISFF